MLALAVAERNGVSLTAAEANNSLDPLHIAIRLALVRIRHELILSLTGATIDDVALDTAHIRLTDDNTVLVLRNSEAERLSLARRPRLGVVDLERNIEEGLEERNANARAAGDRVTDGLAVGDADGGLGTSKAADDGGHGDVPIDELLVGEDLDFGAVLAVAALDRLDGRGCEVLDGGGGLESLQVGGFHDFSGAIGLEDDDVV